ncbi:transketolase family protein [Candidatus Berkelbacteria bacterium]|nr:transketolase family protein [Candidatus Berkelbacteria bacterium]
MANLNPKLYSKDVEQVPIRNGYGEGLVAAGELSDQVVALCADLTESTRTQAFAEKFPERFIQVGVAEQNLATVASGLAAAGKIPFVTSYATFSPGRNWEQIRTTICYNDQPVKVIGSHAGISVGPDGATHQALEDMAIMRALPNMVVMAPCDHLEAKKATLAALEYAGPVYIRLAREATPVVTTGKTQFKIGEAVEFNPGSDLTIIACGPLVYEAMQAAKQLKAKKISAQVLNMATVKPLDEKAVLSAAKQTGAIVTVEEHQVTGGLGGAVAEFLTQHQPVPQEFIGVRDRFGESGEPAELLEKFGLKAKHIIEASLKVIRRKRQLNVVSKIDKKKVSRPNKRSSRKKK